MASKIKGHRRNVAFEQGQQQFRFSTPTNDLQFPRFSFEPKQISALTFRSSDILKASLEPNSYNFIGQSKTEKTIGAKPKRNLLATLDNLQEKLLVARKQFMVEEFREQNSSNFELNSYKESSSCSHRWTEQQLLEKLEQSTINLESHKKLLDAVTSKQRIIWANEIKTYYLSEIARGIAGLSERGSQHLTISLQILKSCKDIDLPPKPTILLPKSQSGKKTLVIDLDQTLFHYSDDRNHKEDMEVTIRFDDTDEKGYVSIRPFAISFLRRIKKYFEVVAFTASERSYADSILNQIDPDYDLIKHRLYREHCYKLNNKLYAKDLRILGRDLSQTVLIDNSPFSYIFQLSNAIPIISYYSGDDTELLKLEKYLELIAKADDVRTLNSNTFQLHRYSEFQDDEQLFKELYSSQI